MAQTLNPTLAAAQDSATRRPLVEIISMSAAADIPFDGLTLAGTTASEHSPFALTHSAGFVIALYISGTDLKYTRTDLTGEEFTTTTISISLPVMGLSACELTGGNIGLAYFVTEGGNYKLKYRIITPDGEAVSDGEIGSWASSVFTSHSWVITRGANDYLMVYAKASGANYYIYKRTSSDFITWGAESALTIGGLTLTKKVDSPSLVKLASGTIWLWFDYVESTDATGADQRNIYYSASGDNGATWGAAVKLTSYSGYASKGKHPMVLQTAADAVKVVYTEETSVLKIDGSAPGWPSASGSGIPQQLHFDPVSRTIYMWTSDYNTGYSILIKINLDTWTVDRYWDTTATTPRISSGYKNNISGTVTGDGSYLPVTAGNTFPGVDVINGEADTISRYYFKDDGAKGFVRNVDVNFYTSPWGVKAVQVDAAAQRLYIAMGTSFSFDNGGNPDFQVGYIDLAESATMYAWHQVVRENLYPGGTCLRVSPAEDLVIMSGSDSLRVWTMGGAVYKTYKRATHADFPYSGIEGSWYFGGNIIWATFPYQSGYGDVDRRGLLKIDISTDTFSYHRPTYATVDDYDFRDMAMGEDGTLYVTHYGYGVAIYDIDSDTWSLYNDATVPGLSTIFVQPNPTINLTELAYDPLLKLVICGNRYNNSIGNLNAFSIYGAMKQGQYYDGTYNGSVWSFTDKGALVQGRSDYDAAVTIDPNNAISFYTFWESAPTTTEKDIRWDKEGSSLDLSPYLLRGREISIERSIDGATNELEFGVSHGHLFDPHNIRSLLRDKLRKGRKLVVRWGEKVGGTDYWHPAGTFYITENRVSYERGKYTDMTVMAEDVRIMWDGDALVATDHYTDFPEAIISDVAQQFGGMEAGDVSLPTFANRSQLDHQWLDTTVAEVIGQLCERFGYFPRITVDNTLSARRISDANPIDHIYSDTTTIISFAPDDRYSDFTNRVNVTGMERGYLEVQYAEERVGKLNGTVGWYGYKNEFIVNYSEDRSRTCINPRLVVLETATSIGFELGGKVSEYISYVDPENKYCIVTVSAPNLIPALTAAVAGYIGCYWLPDNVAGTVTSRIGTRVQAIFGLAIMMILSAIGNFQFEVWATPVGRVRRTVQGSADDEEHQHEIGRVVARKLEDPLCYSVADCETVAGQELLISRLQRSRVKVTKVAHLQDEEGDTLQLPHPHTGDPVRLIAANIKRRMQIPEGQNGDGYFIDDIGGWVR